VTLKQLSIAGDRAVDKVTAVKETLKARRQVFRKFQFIPTQSKLFHYFDTIQWEGKSRKEITKAKEIELTKAAEFKYFFFSAVFFSRAEG
jgi:hypothetical protein